MLGWLNASPNSIERRDELSTTVLPISMPQLQLSGKDPAKGVFSIMHSYFETQCKYSLFTKYLTSTNMPTDQQKKRAQKILVTHCPNKRGSTLCHN